MKGALNIVAGTIVLVVAGIVVSGCITQAKPSSVQANTFVNNQAKGKVSPAPISTPANDAAQLRPGLVININVLVAGKKEIDSMAKRLTDKRTIGVPLLGTVGVNGLTLDDLSAKLTTAYAEYFMNPQVIVEFVRDDNREGLSPWGSVTVLGRVKKPGKIIIPATRDLTLSAAIQQAGGFDTSAKENAIRVTRRRGDGSIQTREVDLRSVGAQGLVEEDIQLEPDDVVFVPEMVF